MTKTDPKKITLPGNESILWALALAQTLGFAHAALTFESGSMLVLQLISGARGILLGAALSFGMAVAAQKVPRVKAKRARETGYLALAGLLVLSPVIMAPAVYINFPAAMRVLGDGLLWVIAAATAIAPDCVAIAVAVQSGALQAQSEEPPVVSANPAQTAQPEERTPVQTAQVQPKVQEQKPMVQCTEPGCGMQYAARGGKGGHYKKWHAPVQIDQTLLLRKGKE